MKKLTLTLLFSTALTACYSSGGGGGSVNVPTTPATNTSGSNVNSGQAVSVTPKTEDSTTASTSTTVTTATTANTTTAANTGTTTGTTTANTNADTTTANTSTTNTNTTSNHSNNESAAKTFKEIVANAFQNTNSQTLAGVIYIPSASKAINPAVNDDLEVLNIEGKQIVLLNTNDQLKVIQLKSLSNKDIKEGVRSLTGYVGSTADSYGVNGTYQDPNSFRAMRYGVAIVDGVSSPFVQGFLTPETASTNVRGEVFYAMPTKSSFKYTGSAVYGKDTSYQQLKSEVIADFSNKKVQVNLLENSTVKATFGGEISGNKFAGERNQIETKGAFYGSLARDVGGVFEDKASGNNGAFGASDKRSISTDLSSF